MKGAIGETTNCQLGDTCFNPHAHEGRDLTDSHQAEPAAFVSIRTPMKGAILKPVFKNYPALGFNPHAHEGRDGRMREWQTADRQVSIRTPMKGAIYTC